MTARTWLTGNWETVLTAGHPSAWIKALTAEARSGTVSHWENIFARYRDVRADLRRNRCSPRHPRLLRRTRLLLRGDAGPLPDPLPAALAFPRSRCWQAERARVSALPPGEQIAYYVSRLKRYDGLINSEEAQKALHGFGSAAIPALLPLLRQR